MANPALAPASKRFDMVGVGGDVGWREAIAGDKATAQHAGL
jgi:hypothetical protein